MYKEKNGLKYFVNYEKTFNSNDIFIIVYTNCFRTEEITKKIGTLEKFIYDKQKIFDKTYHSFSFFNYRRKLDNMYPCECYLEGFTCRCIHYKKLKTFLTYNIPIPKKID